MGSDFSPLPLHLLCEAKTAATAEEGERCFLVEVEVGPAAAFLLSVAVAPADAFRITAMPSVAFVLFPPPPPPASEHLRRLNEGAAALLAAPLVGRLAFALVLNIAGTFRLKEKKKKSGSGEKKR